MAEVQPQSPFNPHIFTAQAGDSFLYDGNNPDHRHNLDHINLNLGFVASNNIFPTDPTYQSMASLAKENVDLHYGATHDSLTGIANRRALQDFLSNPSNKVEGMLYIDLDGFKGVNDTHGHDMGDELLKLVARKLERLIRKSDFVARIGGDEFVVVIGSGENDTAPAGKENLREIKTQDEIVDGAESRLVPSVIEVVTPALISTGVTDAAIILEIESRVSASIGDVRKGPLETNEQLLRRADEAMYKNKKGRKDALQGILTAIPGADYVSQGKIKKLSA
ncbi:MAG: diguanylate cyclase [Candidatus Saccharibacteria bacterium]|nr:diguanylate cyclase [Candidatus Saccharibacteria bacterium]